MKKKYELVVKGINNYPDKITVTVALEIGGYPSLLLPDVAISLDRTEGATLEFYEAEAKKQAKQFFMDVAAGLCEGDGPLPEKRPIILEAQDVLITYRGKLPGIITNNYPDKITVTVALEIGGYPSLLLPDVAISLDRTEGATLEFYEAEAKKQAKQFFMDVAAGLCEGDGPLPEKRPIILEAQDVLITYRGKLPGIITGSLKTPPLA